MFPRIDPQSDLPIYEQIVRHVKFAVAREALSPGDMLSSVREMAGQMAVNANTVARAYRDLQREGIIESIRGTGMQVTPEARTICRKERKKLVQERLREALQEAHGSELSEEEIKSWLEKEVARLWK